jgi:Plasma-membrane choline transporter
MIYLTIRILRIACEGKFLTYNRLTRFHTVAKLIVGIGQLGIAIVTTLCGVFIAYQVRPLENLFADNTYLFVIIAICSVVITITFLGVYSIAIDTLYSCYYEDMTRNAGTAEKPYHMSNRMRILLALEVEVVELK